MAKLLILTSDGTFREQNALVPSGTQVIPATVPASGLGTLAIVNSDGSYRAAIDLTQPTATVTINGGAAATNQQTVVLAIVASNAASMRLSNDNLTWSEWETYSPSKVWMLAGGDGSKTVYLQLKNASDVYSELYIATIIYDTTNPTGVISAAATYTKTTSVNLLVSATAGDGSAIAEMRFSDDDSNWSAWEAYSSAKIWTVPAGDGVKTIYGQFKDLAGNVSLSASTSITLFSGVPVVSLDSTPAATTNNPISSFAFSTPTPNTTFQVRVDNGASLAATSHYTTPPLANGQHTFYVTAVHASGAISQPATFSWTVNTLAVVATLAGVPASVVNSDSADITVAGSGVTHYKYRLNGGSWSAETAVADHILLTSLDGLQQLEVIGKNGDGLWQVVATSASWTAITRIFNTTQPFTFGLTAGIELYPLFYSEQPFSYGLTAEDAQTPLQTFVFGLTASSSGGSVEMLFDSSQPFTFGQEADFSPAVVVPPASVPTFASSQTFAFGLTADFLAGNSYETNHAFTFTLAAASLEEKQFDANHAFTFVLAAEISAAGSRHDSEQPFVFGLAADFTGYQQFDASQPFTFSVTADSASATTSSDAVAYALNCRTLRGSEYSHFAFNSLARQGSACYGLASDGLYQLTGSNDAGTPINANLIGGIANFNDHRLKLFPTARLFLRGEGEFELTVTTDETKRRSYPVSRREGQQGAHTKRVSLARGIRGRTVQLEVSNVAGAHFELQEIQLDYEATSRT